MSAASVRLIWPLASWPNPNRARRQHWAHNGSQASAIRTAAKLLALQALTRTKPLTPPVHMHLAFAFPDKRSRDLLNVDTKALVDGVVDSGLIAEDNWAHVPLVTIEYDDHKTERGHLRVTVTLTEIGGSDG